MTYGAFPSNDFAPFDAPRPRPRRRRRTSKGSAFAVALTLCGGVGAVLLSEHAVPVEPGSRAPVAAAPPLVHAASSTPAVVAAGRTSTTARYASLFDQTLTAGREPGAFADSVSAAAVLAALPAAEARTASPEPQLALPSTGVPDPDLPMPLPRRRPATDSAGRNVAGRLPVAVAEPGPAPAPAAPAAPPGFFERMFGRAQTAPGQALAYNAPEDGVVGVLGTLASRTAGTDSFTAVYDIAAHTVTLPDGTRLEAHSGLGSRKDDPNSVTEHMRGATPPAVYELQPREALFHGVRALRLTPVAGTTYGREGLLAHTFMLGPNGDSNGCVVFRDYRAFLAAYDRGQIHRLVVVAGSYHRL